MLCFRPFREAALTARGGRQGEHKSIVVEGVFNPRFGNLEVVRRKFDADIVKAAPQCGQPARPTAHERVKDGFTRVCNKQRKMCQQCNGLGARMEVLVL